MKENTEIDLLLDVSKLLKKYGFETFDALANEIASPNFIEKLSRVLSTTAKVSYLIEEHKKLNSGKSSDIVLEKLMQVDREKSEGLIPFYKNLKSKKVLSNLANLRLFTSTKNLPPLKATTYNKAIAEIVDVLSNLNLPDLKEKLSSIELVLKSNELEDWSKIILERKR